MPNLLGNMDRAQFVKIIAILLIILGVLQLFAGAAALLGGGLLGATAGAVAVSGVATTSEGAAATAAAGATGGLLVIYGAVLLFVGILSLIAAIALFRRFAWARMATFVVMILGFAGQLLGLLTGGFSLLTVLYAVIYIVGAYIFFSDEPLKNLFKPA
ncbi:MAG: hypothetical protein JNL34_14830 [Anaerolineae bacterium]|nr:hypothetical protein [Anaerolineae bacterium]